jgi:abequosyltransferase
MAGVSTEQTAGGPLLTVAIPTFNRAGYLEQNLAQLRSELRQVQPGLVEVLVSDNCSPDSTPSVVERAQASGLSVRYVRNAENVGWGRNFAQAFDLARGKYVLLLGDDDLFVDGALVALLERLANRDFGVVCLRPYGYDEDWRAEHPGAGGRDRVFTDSNEFLIAIGHLMTLTSSCVLNKPLLANVDSKQFASGDLGALHLVLRAALAGRENLFVDRYVLAGKRQNSFNYEWAVVFVGEMWRIIDAQVPHGLREEAIRTIERNTMFSYYPFYLLDLRLSGRGDLKVTREEFARRFPGRWLYRLWLEPTIRLPRPLAIFWGAATTFIGRAFGGDLRRGIKFAWNKLARRRTQGQSTRESTVS